MTILLSTLKGLLVLIVLFALVFILLFRSDLKRPVKASVQAPYSYETDLYKGLSWRSALSQALMPAIRKSKVYPDLEAYRQSVLADQADNVKIPTAKLVSRCTATELTINGIRTVKLVPKQTGNNRAIFYMHGGSYLKGPLKEQWRMLNHIAHATGCTIYVPLYTLGLEGPFPQGLNDGMAVYREVVTQYGRGELLLMGDSAGGGMILSMAQVIRDEGLKPPGKLIAIAPWINLAGDHPEIMDYARKDPLLQIGNLDYAAALYADTTSLDNPLVSPIHMDLNDLPPCLMMIGTHDLLYPDCADFERKARTADYDLTYIKANKMIHVWPAGLGYFPEARKGIKQIVDYILHYPIQI